MASSFKQAIIDARLAHARAEREAALEKARAEREAVIDKLFEREMDGLWGALLEDIADFALVQGQSVHSSMMFSASAFLLKLCQVFGTQGTTLAGLPNGVFAINDADREIVFGVARRRMNIDILKQPTNPEMIRVSPSSFIDNMAIGQEICALGDVAAEVFSQLKSNEVATVAAARSSPRLQRIVPAALKAAGFDAYYNMMTNEFAVRLEMPATKAQRT